MANDEPIERTNFSTTRRGYDPLEVDAHLGRVADRFAELERELEDQKDEFQRRKSSGASLSGAAADRVRSILDAAESSAAELRRQAEEEANTVLEDARRDAGDMAGEARRHLAEARERADTEAVAYVERVQAASARLLERSDRLEAEFDSTFDQMRSTVDQAVESLRGDAMRLQSELDTLRVQLSDLRGIRDHSGFDTTGQTPIDTGEGRALDDRDLPADPDAEEREGLVEEDRDAAPSARGFGRRDDDADDRDRDYGRDATDDRGAVFADEEDDDHVDPTPTEVLSPGRGRAGSDGAGSAGSSDRSSEGARLIALNMALNGTPREETADYLERTFNLVDEAMLDDVYARVRT